ncbi:LysR family transcriptional regulator [Nocardioides sp.]|uniref:LysR family transcriptional regulator n=1 Tax=Nocardioides sp. TaxID=35761 RepID=UPI0039E30A7E
MDLRHLVALVTVGDLGSVTAAARALHLVQPAVTRQIRALEDDLGVRLFERTRNGMSPTTAGEILIERARRALAEIERGEALVRQRSEEVAGVVTVGLLDSLAATVALPLEQAVRRNLPNVSLRILAGYSGDVRAWAESGDLDLSTLYAIGDSALGLATPLVRESLWAVAPAAAGLSRKRPVSWSEVCRHPLTLPVPGHGLRSLIDLGLAEVDQSPTIAFETNSMTVQKQAVLDGRAWTVLPAVGAAADVADGALSAAPVRDPEIIRTVALSLTRVRPGITVEAVAGQFIAVVRRLVRSRRWPATLLVTEEPDLVEVGDDGGQRGADGADGGGGGQ